MSVQSLINDPDFAKLDPGEQKATLAALDPDFAKIGDNELPQVIQGIRSAQPVTPPTPPPTMGDKIMSGAKALVSSPLDVLAAPFQVVGEAARMPIEGDSDFRPPTILQKMGIADKTAQPPADPFNLVNRLVRAGAAGIATGNADTARAEYSRPPNVVDVASDAALAAVGGKIAPDVVNAPIEAAMNAPGEIADVAKSAAGWTGKKLIRGLLGPSEEAQAARFADPEAIKTALAPGQIADKAAETANALSQKISDADNEAWKTLRTDYLPPEEGGTATPKASVIDIINKAKKELSVYGGGVVGKAAKAASAALDGISSDIQDVGKFVGGRIKSQQGADSSIRLNTFLPETTMKGIVQSLDQNIDWDAPDMGPINNALESARVAVDSIIKGQNPDYAAQMDKVAQMTGDLQTMRQKLGLIKETGEGFAAGDTTPGKITAIGRRDMPETGRMLAGVQDATGHDIADEANTSRLSQEFSSGTDRSRGSKRTNIGEGIGAGTGFLSGLITGHPVVGTAVGDMLGRVFGGIADNYGAAAAGHIIDALSSGDSRIRDLIQAANSQGEQSGISPAMAELLKRAYMAPPLVRAEDQYNLRGGR